MTWAQMKVDPAELSRRQAVAVRINRIWDKRNAAPDDKTRRRFDRQIGVIRKPEAGWLKEAAYFLY